MNIIKLTSENVKRLSAVEITPQGNVVILGGKNGQGKSSVLDSIEIALSGGVPPKMPVRRGEEKARVVVDLGEIVVKRTFTAAGGTALVVTNADGVKQASPQAILDKLTGRLTFDPLAFSRQKPKEQADTLRGLVGLNFTKEDNDRDLLFSERTTANRDAKNLEARMNGMPRHDGVPEVETSTASILAEAEKAAAINAANAELHRKAQNLDDIMVSRKDDVIAMRGLIGDDEAEIKEIQERISNRKKALAEKQAAAEAATKAAVEAVKIADELKDIDLAPFRAQAATAEATNAKIRANKARAEIVKQYKAASGKADELTRKMDAIDHAKRQKITGTKYPIEGLAFDTAGGVTLGNIPFEQCSSAEQLKVSVAIGLALNPKLKVLLIRDGSLLDDDSLAMVATMAKEAGAQVWIERVAVDASTSVVIEDGHVKESAFAEEGKLL